MYAFTAKETIIKFNWLGYWTTNATNNWSHDACLCEKEKLEEITLYKLHSTLVYYIDKHYRCNKPYLCWENVFRLFQRAVFSCIIFKLQHAL